MVAATAYLQCGREKGREGKRELLRRLFRPFGGEGEESTKKKTNDD